MKKICRLSKETKIYPKSITKKIVQSHFGQNWLEVDLYQNDTYDDLENFEESIDKNAKTLQKLIKGVKNEKCF